MQNDNYTLENRAVNMRHNRETEAIIDFPSPESTANIGIGSITGVGNNLYVCQMPFPRPLAMHTAPPSIAL